MLFLSGSSDLPICHRSLQERVLVFAFGEAHHQRVAGQLLPHRRVTLGVNQNPDRRRGHVQHADEVTQSGVERGRVERIVFSESRNRKGTQEVF